MTKAIHHNVDQNSPEWNNLRLGKFTTSSLKDLFSSPTTAAYKKAIYQPVYERIAGFSPESFSNGWMDRGKELEPEAAMAYELETFTPTHVCGFFELNEWVGSSPDRLIGEDGLVEIKCPAFNTHMDYLIHGGLPSAYTWQVYGQMYVTGRKYVDFVSYCPGLPLFIHRVKRDESIMKQIDEKLKDSITSATKILEALTKKVKA